MSWSVKLQGTHLLKISNTFILDLDENNDEENLIYRIYTMRDVILEVDIGQKITYIRVTEVHSLKVEFVNEFTFGFMEMIN